MYKFITTLVFIVAGLSYTTTGFTAPVSSHEATGSISTLTGVVVQQSSGGGAGNASTELVLTGSGNDQGKKDDTVTGSGDTDEEDNGIVSDPKNTTSFVGKKFYLTVKTKVKENGKKKRRVDVKAKVIAEEAKRVKVEYKDPRTKKLKTKWVSKVQLHKKKKKSR